MQNLGNDGLTSQQKVAVTSHTPFEQGAVNGLETGCYLQACQNIPRMIEGDLLQSDDIGIQRRYDLRDAVRRVLSITSNAIMCIVCRYAQHGRDSARSEPALGQPGSREQHAADGQRNGNTAKRG